ncbi:MAG: helix-turn-helix transcriptional regulator [Salinivirgaceae bacterium]|nr:helix-turn-helix transcriptional regulator [Salinivirgaceae bacterium]
MDKRFIIIHSSDIIRKGLWAILRESFHDEFILLKDINGINDYSGLSSLQLFVFLEQDVFSRESKDFITRVIDACQEIQYLAIADYSEKLKTEKSISIYQPTSEIVLLVKSIIEKKKPETVQISELSEREKDVLSLVALGHSNKEIAEKLFISIHTVITHRKHITEKLGIKSISGLTVYAILNKLIDTENIDPSSLI